MQIEFTQTDGTMKIRHGTVADAIQMADKGENIKRIIGATPEQWQQLQEQLGVPFCKKVAG